MCRLGFVSVVQLYFTLVFEEGSVVEYTISEVLYPSIKFNSHKIVRTILKMDQVME